MDLSGRGVAYTRARLLQEGFIPRLMRGDAEKLPFADSFFDLVYSWGFIHHSPDTAAAVRDRRFPKTRKMDWVVINGNAAGIDGNPERYVEDGCAVGCTNATALRASSAASTGSKRSWPR